MKADKIRVGLYGTNGHQIQNRLVGHDLLELKAVAEFDESKMPAELKSSDISRYGSLDDLINDDSIQLISLCSPVRRNQANEAIRCLEAGKHVLAEKPCATTEEDLDRLLRAAASAKGRFREMGGTALGSPWCDMAKVVKEGIIGDVVQVFAQKSYPYYPNRPQDPEEDTDGGQIEQNGIHAVRYIEHVTGIKVFDIQAVQTCFGNPVSGGGLVMAASMMMTLENGGVASVIANYLNQPGFGSWGNEHLRVFGTKGFVEAVDAGARTRLVVGGQDRGALCLSKTEENYLDPFAEHIALGTPMPVSLEDEIHPTLMVIKAKAGVTYSRINAR